MSSTEFSVEDDELFILQQNQINQSIHDLTKDLYKKSDVVECIDCGDDIPPERKKALPGTERCVSCAEIIEKRKNR